MDIEELSKKIDAYHEEDKKREEKGRYENLGWVLYGFCLGAISLSATSTRNMDIIIYAIAAVIFFFVGAWAVRKSRKMIIG